MTPPAAAGKSAPVAPVAPADTFDALVVRGSELLKGRDAAHFLAGQLQATGNHLNYPDAGFGVYADTGNTIDAILALDATGTGGAAADAATTWVEANAKDYVTYTPTAPSSGPAGKTLILAVVQGRDPRAFGGLDLISTLEDLVTAEGRFGTAGNDYGVTINQVLPMIGLTRAGVSVPATSVSFLAKQQCTDGGVRGGLDATTCVSDPDATAFAAQAFLAVGDTVHATAALDYLESRQRANGALTNASGEGANANTTGVAAQAFALGGRSAAHLKAAKFIVSLQWSCNVTAKYRGGIAFTSGDLKVTPANVEKATRATPQATLGLVAGSLVTVESDSVVAATTARACATPTQPTTPTPTVAPTTTAPAGSGQGGSGQGGSVRVPALGGAVIDGPGHGLAYTGASLALPLSIAVLLLLAGAATILVSRRRGAHQ